MAKANQNRGIPGIAELLEDFAFFTTLNLNLQYFIQSFWDN